MKINMTSKDGVTLLTQGKYCTEDIEVTPTFETGGGGSDIVVEVNELPTENIDESKIYVVNKVSDINVYYCYGDGYLTLAEAVASSIGATPTIYYEVVDELPASPTATDLQAFNPIYCYIYNNVPYVYGNAGSGNMWLTISALFAQMGAPIEDKGRTYDIASETEEGLYVYWVDKIVGTPIVNESFSLRNSQWINNTRYRALFLKQVTELVEDDFLGMIETPSFLQADNDFLKSVAIPNGVTELKYGAFYGCSSLTSVAIGKDVSSISIGGYTFYSSFSYCSSLKDIIVDENNQNYSSVNGVLYNKQKTTIIKYPAGKEDASFTIPESVTTITEGTFFGCENLTTIEIPNTLIDIKTSAFQGCAGLTSITIPNSVTWIGERAFNFCSSLKEVIVPNSVRYFYSSAFESCGSLEKIVFGNTLERLPEYVVAFCYNLKTIVLGTGIKAIGYRAFYQCTSLQLLDCRNVVFVPSLDLEVFDTTVTPKIVVPDALYDSWIVATGWTLYASYIIKASQYTGL